VVDDLALARVINDLPSVPLEQTFFRVIHAKYAATALSAVGSYRHGGRYNPAGAFEVLYLADNPVTALEEVEALLRSGAALQGIKGPPRILLSVECVFQRVARLDQKALQALNLTVADITASWREKLRRSETPVTHVIGRSTFERGDVEALLVPSAKNPKMQNLAVFPDRLLEGSSLRVFDDSGMIDARLPRRS
jgi:RES domain-containing protein